MYLMYAQVKTKEKMNKTEDETYTTLQCVARKLEHIVKENERKIEKERKIRELEQKRSEAFYELGVFMGQYKY